MLEVIVSMMIVSSLFLFSITKVVLPSYEYQYFISDYLLCQAQALKNYERVDFENKYSEYEIHFNNKGSVNQGQSFNIDGKRIVIRPSTGYIRYE